MIFPSTPGLDVVSVFDSPSVTTSIFYMKNNAREREIERVRWREGGRMRMRIGREKLELVRLHRETEREER